MKVTSYFLIDYAFRLQEQILIDYACLSFAGTESRKKLLTWMKLWRRTTISRLWLVIQLADEWLKLVSSWLFWCDRTGIVIESWIGCFSKLLKTHLKNQLARGGCLRAYKHMVKLILNQCGTLGSKYTCSSLPIAVPRSSQLLSTVYPILPYHSQAWWPVFFSLPDQTHLSNTET